MIQNKFSKFYKVLGSGWLSQIYKPESVICSQKRKFSFMLNWFLHVFNGVDRERLELVGPNCACAEWLIRNGAAVRFKGHSDLLNDYNELIRMEEEGAKSLKVEEVFAQDAGLTTIGFNHFKDCNYVKKITLIYCNHIRGSSLKKLIYLEKSLEYLELRSCFNINDKALGALHNLSNLKTLKLSDLISVKNKDQCEAALRKALPHCYIDFSK